jgi:UDP-GlcNAc:undecaprenyl-phosphate GlcNAc-1-phosphate transferase
MLSAVFASVLDPSAAPHQLVNERFLRALEANLGPGVRPALLALAVVSALTPLAIWIAPRLGLVSHPARERDIHTRPTPKMGGLAMYAGFAAAGLAFLPHDMTLAGFLILGGAATVIFALDDRFDLPPMTKLVFQVGLAVAAVKVFGFGIDSPYLPIVHVPLHLGLLVLPVTVAWIVGMQNTVNLIDGVDGLAAGVVAIVALVLMIAEASRPGPDQREVIVLSAALAASCLGFLVLNFNPAQIFMGDSGAHFLGTALALLAVLGVAKVAVGAALLVPLVALAVPIADTAWAIVRRKQRGMSFARADAKHLHHRLLHLGLSQRQTCVLFYSATGVLGAVALTIFGHKRVLVAVIALILVVASVLLGERLLVWRWRVPVPGGRIVGLIQQRRSMDQ